MNQTELLTVEEVAEMLRLTTKGIYAMVAEWERLASAILKELRRAFYISDKTHPEIAAAMVENEELAADIQFVLLGTARLQLSVARPAQQSCSCTTS